MTPTSLSIRTYQVGFGDCFLLSFAYADGHEAHVLVDFGSTGLPKAAAKKHMLAVAADIQARTGGKLDVIVATHRHKDHISGFATSSDGKGTGDLIASLKPGAVIQPWTEDPNAKRDALKATTKERALTQSERRALHVTSLDEMRAVAQAATKVNSRMRMALGFEAADKLKFIADDNLPNESAVKNLAAMGARGEAHYVNAGMKLDLSAWLPGVKVHVLGPPDLEQTDTVRKQRAADETQFWHFWRKSAAAGTASVETRDGGKALFADEFIWQQKDKPPSARWFSQRITEAHGGALMELVRVLDDAMNNTSVILLFEVGGKKLLFPGDAQLENWAYAVTMPGVAKLLEDVDVYKVGHHGSLNATPKQLLWSRFKKKKSSSSAPLQSLLSTMHGKHGDDARGTEVPRSKLVDALKKETHLLDTEHFTGLFEDTVINFDVPRAKKKTAAPKRVKETEAEDPLRRLSRTASKPRRAAKRFEGGEHTWLGNAGAQQACMELRREGLDIADEEFLTIARLRGDEALQYGELVALSGDFYESPSELFEERAAPMPWLFESNDVRELRDLFRVELKWIEERQRGRGGEAWPDQNVRFWWNAKSYTELAQKNVEHFGWHNMKAYCRYHGAALTLARQAKGRGGELWQRALTYNAFADHFLTDGFAAGHVRVPRRELIAWGAAQGYSERLTGVLSKVLHDQDGHAGTLHGDSDHHVDVNDGLAVRNAEGVRWKTFCDGQLFLYPGAATQPHVREPMRAVAASVKELVRAWKTGAIPDATYAATRHVAFPDGPETLSVKFGAFDAARVKALHKSIAGYLKVLSSVSTAHLSAVLSALPELLVTFRANVAADLESNSELARRLPTAYIDAYRALE